MASPAAPFTFRVDSSGSGSGSGAAGNRSPNGLGLGKGRGTSLPSIKIWKSGDSISVIGVMIDCSTSGMP